MFHTYIHIHINTYIYIYTYTHTKSDSEKEKERKYTHICIYVYTPFQLTEHMPTVPQLEKNPKTQIATNLPDYIRKVSMVECV